MQEKHATSDMEGAHKDHWGDMLGFGFHPLTEALSNCSR